MLIAQVFIVSVIGFCISYGTENIHFMCSEKFPNGKISNGLQKLTSFLRQFKLLNSSFFLIIIIIYSNIHQVFRFL